MDVAQRAREFAAQAYASPRELDHPNEVADLVEGAGCPPDVVVAAILHDLVEDTDVEAVTIAREFGSRVAALVASMTEDESIPGYEERKAEHRARAAAAGRDCALIFVADKLSNARRMRGGAKRPDARKLGHYAATLELMRERYPDLPLLDDLERELAGLGRAVEAS